MIRSSRFSSDESLLSLREDGENQTVLVGAEIARREGRDMEAMRLYEEAIRLARANGFVQNEALAYEVAARFYAARDFEEFARVYLRKARDGYLRWGADGKVRHLEEMYPQLREEEPGPGGNELNPAERKRAEQALRDSEEQWKAVFENNPTMYFMVDASGAVVSVNPLGAEQLGYTVDELIGTAVENLFHLEDRGAVERHTAICFKRPGQTMSWEVRKIRKNGEMLWVREMARVMLIKDRPVALIVCEDITERKRVSEALREVQSELARANRVMITGQLTASIAHEVNQPIAATVTNAQAALRWLSARQPDLEEARQALARIVEDGKRAADVIHRIRDLIKKAPVRKECVAINDAIREVIALSHGEAEKNGVFVHLQLAEDLPLIDGDRVQLQQVILNLIINALEAMCGVSEGARKLLISTDEAEAGGVLVAVQDSGPGLSPATFECLFDAFYTTKSNGLGLGLSICRSIIEAHGGRLWAEANVPHGAIFRFTLPQFGP